jgi:hypothetical protein
MRLMTIPSDPLSEYEQWNQSEISSQQFVTHKDETICAMLVCQILDKAEKCRSLPFPRWLDLSANSVSKIIQSLEKK